MQVEKNSVAVLDLLDCTGVAGAVCAMGDETGITDALGVRCCSTAAYVRHGAVVYS